MPRLRITLPILALITCASALLAHSDTHDPDVKARMHLMKQVKEQMGTLGKMANGALPFDAGAATAAKTELARYAYQIPAKFENAASDPTSEALPIIWTQFEDFSKRASDMQNAFEALDTSSLDSMRAGLADAGGTCGACHKPYREKKK